ncbi:MAG TPA: hypothetical protein VMS92_10275 [Mycobacterium sp.]|nr:hypothetical protein [Mycobacterium sp.]
MTVPRTVFTAFHDLATALVTYQPDDHARDGVWSKPSVPLLIFSDSDILNAQLTYGNGAVAGAAGGHPVQLIFWGQWWNGPAGQQRLALIQDRTQSLLNSPYFSELTQYGVPHAPIWRGGTIVTTPAPPLRLSSQDTTQSVKELVGALIDDGVFPDPDDGPRIAFIVLMPDGFTVINSGVLGAHSNDYDWDFPFDTDTYWAGWVRPEPATPEFTMVTLSHELTEMLTDPEADAWRLSPVNGSNTEVSDVSFSSGRTVRQNAFVNGTQVEAYWSNRHGATVIPIDRDYGARLRARITESARRESNHGHFRPTPSDSVACSPELPECCFPDRDYEWRSYTIDETARVRLVTQRYRTPVAAWTINGNPVSGSGSVALAVTVDGFNGRTPTSGPGWVTVQYVTRPDGIDISANNVGVNFEIVVACVVTDGSITGNVLTNVVATPIITVDFLGAQVNLDDAYTQQRSKCLKAMLRRYVHNYKPTGKPGVRDPINFVRELLTEPLPAYVRPSQYEKIQLAARAVRAANAMLPAETAQRFTRSLIEEIPALQLLFMSKDRRPQADQPG